MPFHDGTGPYGDGRPGRGMGTCGRFGVPARGGFGMGHGRGRGMGYRARRFWNWFRPNSTAANQDIYPYTKEDLQAQKEDLEQQIKWLNEQIDNYKEN
jgi:hypothetical protein